MFKIYTRYGLITAAILIAYFLLLKLIGLHNMPVFSAANGLIFAVGIYLAMKSYKNKKSRFKYQKGFQLGLFTGGIATLVFTVFMAIFIYQIDSEFADTIVEGWSLDMDSGKLLILISLVFMGFSTSLVLTLSFMQLLKDTWNDAEGKRNSLK